MQLGARSARARVAHHPEIVLLVAVDNVHVRIESRPPEQGGPQVPGLLIPGSRIAEGRIGLVNRCVQTLRREFPAANHQFPSPFDRLLLEIIAERPVPEHLEEGVMVGIQTHVLEVVMLAAGADALLRVGRARVRARDDARPAGNVGVLLPEEDRDELVHPGIGEEQIRGIRHQTRGRDKGVVLLAEEIEKRLSDLGAVHHSRCKRLGTVGIS